MDLDKVISIKCEAKSYFQLDELNHFQGDLKSIDKDQFLKLKKSLISDGLPIGFHVWVDKKNKVWTIDGHHRVLALKALRDDGYDIPSLPCVIVQAKDKKEAAKAVLINNSKYAKMSQESLSDFMIGFELNVVDLDFLDLPDLNMGDFGLDEKTKEGLTDDDAVPDVAQNIHGVTLGDIYQLGNHRLMCGDSTSIDAVEKLMAKQAANILFTDPPYGISLGFDESKEQAKARNRRTDGLKVANDNLQGGDLEDFLSTCISNAFTILVPGGAFYVCSPIDKEVRKFISALEKSDAHYQAGLVWNKSSLSLSRFDYHPKHEIIHYGWKPGASHNWFTDRKQTTVFDFDKPSKSELHPTTKPVELIEYYLKNSSKERENVLDLFGGSGSTLIACEKTNRKCFMMELDPHYCSVIIERWQNFTGLKAKLITE